MVQKNPNLIVSEDGIIPAFPAVIVEINRIIDLPETNYKKLSAIIQKDAAICARILKIVNSAFYGMASEISAISDAVSVLGFDFVHRIAITVSVLNTIKINEKDKRFNEVKLLKHLFFTAQINRFLSMNYHIVNPSDAYVVGLLHDIGKFILYKMSPEYYYEIEKKVLKDNISFFDAENQVQGFPSHSELGAFAAKQWRFPKKLVESIKYHHNYNTEIDSQSDLILLITSNFIENNKKNILNSYIDSSMIHPSMLGYFNNLVKDIDKWLPKLLSKSEKEFYTFAESIT